MKQLATYFLLAFLISWLIWFPLYSPHFGITGLPVLPFHHAIGALGPMLAAFITNRIYNGQQLWKGMFKITPVIYILIALAGPFVLALMAALISDKPVNLSPLLTIKEFPSFSFAGFFVYNLLFFGLGEETGWRGFALPHLQRYMNGLLAATVLTVFWALWHLPLFLYRPGFMTMGIGGAIGWFFSLFTGSLLLSWLYNSSKGSILACALLHATIDIVFLADFSDPAMTNYMGMLITVWGIVTVIVFRRQFWYKKKRDGYVSL